MYIQSAQRLVSTPLTIEYDTSYHKLVVNHHIAPLSPKEYELAMALLRQRQQWETAEAKALLCLSVAQLMDITHIRPQGTLVRHLSNAGMKLAPLGIYIVNARTYGYFILFESEVTGNPT